MPIYEKKICAQCANYPIFHYSSAKNVNKSEKSQLLVNYFAKKLIFRVLRAFKKIKKQTNSLEIAKNIKVQVKHVFGLK